MSLTGLLIWRYQFPLINLSMHTATSMVVGATGVLGVGHLTVASNALCSLLNPASAVAASADVRLDGVLNLGTGVSETVARLFLNGVEMPGGIWNATRDPVHFTGAGNLTVANSGVTPVPPQLTMGQGGGELFPFQVNGVAGFTYVVQASTNLAIWTDLFTTNPLTMPFEWQDFGAANYPRRFYRVRLVP